MKVKEIIICGHTQCGACESLYKEITNLRNHLYDSGARDSKSFDRFVISVGNLTVGGTGKTPFVELLIRELKTKYRLAILSRGYKRKTRGFKLADESDDSLSLGDEPYQYFKKPSSLSSSLFIVPLADRQDNP